MTQQDKKQETTITPQPDAEKKEQTTELSEEELKKTTGGTGAIFLRYNFGIVAVKT